MNIQKRRLRTAKHQQTEKYKVAAARASKKYRAAHPERLKKRRDRFVKKNPNYFAIVNQRWRTSKPIDSLYQSIKTRAKSKGVEFSVSVDYLKSLPLTANCPVLGTPMCFQSKDRDSSISLDRIIPSLGYVKGNVRWISFRANRLLGDGVLDEFKKVVTFLKENPI